MAFKMKSGNKVSFKNMGSSSPGKQKLKTTDLGDAFQKGLSGRIDPGDEGYVGNLSGKDRNKGLVAEEKRLAKTKANTDTTTNKESKTDVGDTKSEWNFDFMDLLKSFLSSGGGKGGLLKAAGGALTKKSPNELLAMQKARAARKKKKTDAQNLKTDIITGKKLELDPKSTTSIPGIKWPVKKISRTI